MGACALPWCEMPKLNTRKGEEAVLSFPWALFFNHALMGRWKWLYFLIADDCLYYVRLVEYRLATLYTSLWQYQLFSSDWIRCYFNGCSSIQQPNTSRTSLLQWLNFYPDHGEAKLAAIDEYLLSRVPTYGDAASKACGNSYQRQIPKNVVRFQHKWAINKGILTPKASHIWRAAPWGIKCAGGGPVQKPINLVLPA